MFAIRDVPYQMAVKRDHPYADASRAGGWISLFTLPAIWPFLWIWATGYHPEHGYAGTPRGKTDEAGPEGSNAPSRVAALEKKIAALEANASKSSGPQPK